jgi:hypothetical protein
MAVNIVKDADRYRFLSIVGNILVTGWQKTLIQLALLLTNNLKTAAFSYNP